MIKQKIFCVLLSVLLTLGISMILINDIKNRSILYIDNGFNFWIYHESSILSDNDSLFNIKPKNENTVAEFDENNWLVKAFKSNPFLVTNLNNFTYRLIPKKYIDRELYSVVRLETIISEYLVQLDSSFSKDNEYSVKLLSMFKGFIASNLEKVLSEHEVNDFATMQKYICKFVRIWCSGNYGENENDKMYSVSRFDLEPFTLKDYHGRCYYFNLYVSSTDLDEFNYLYEKYASAK